MESIETTEPVVSTPAGLKRGGTKKRIIIIACILAVLLSLGGLIAWQVKAAREQAAFNKAVAVKSDKLKYEHAIKQSNILRGQRKYDEAIKVLQTYADSSLHTGNKGYSFLAMGNIYESKPDYRKAYDMYKKADGLQTEQQMAVNLGLARTAQQLGNKNEAIDHYRELLRHYEVLITKHPNDMYLQRDLDHYRENLKALEAAR